MTTYDFPVLAEPDSRSGEEVLRIDGLGRSFGSRTIVGSLDLAIGRGERVALRGPNGSGKSTVLRCIAGTLAPSSGCVSIAGHEAGSQEARRRVGVSLAQERSFYLRLTGRDNLIFYARLRGPKPRHGGAHGGGARRGARARATSLPRGQIAARRA